MSYKVNQTVIKELRAVGIDHPALFDPTATVFFIAIKDAINRK